MQIENALQEQETTQITKPDMKKNWGGILGHSAIVEALDGEMEPEHNGI